MGEASDHPPQLRKRDNPQSQADGTDQGDGAQQEGHFSERRDTCHAEPWNF
jgi:hypothetical protein